LHLKAGFPAFFLLDIKYGIVIFGCKAQSLKLSTKDKMQADLATNLM